MADVSRETPRRPTRGRGQGASRRRGSRSLERYAALLATEGVVRGLIGPREVPRLWDRHLVNCGLLATADPRRARRSRTSAPAPVCPGLVLALARPDLRVTLIEPMAAAGRRSSTEAVRRRSGLDGVDGGARSGGGAARTASAFDVVTVARAGPAAAAAGLERCRWCAPGGALLAMKGSSAAEEIEAAAAELARWRAQAEVVVCEVPGRRRPRPWSGWSPAAGAAIGWPASATTRRRRRERR